MNLHEFMLAKQLAGKNSGNIPVPKAALFAYAISGEISDTGFTSFDDYFMEE